MKAPEGGDFWNIDLARLSLSGWLLMLLMIAIAGGGLVVVVLFMPRDWPDATRKKVAWIAFIPILGVAALVFIAGRKWLDSIGWPILRPAKHSPSAEP